ncbi:MAG: phosphate-starvation-inducible PsiE family protein [Bacteroidales bacterium]|nr:phosphate-starvation-inducible PsiE family protein [Bacteroidales bacterium]
MIKIIEYIERGLIWGIILLMSLILVLAFVDIVYVIKEKALAPPLFIIDANGLMSLFSLFLVLLIGLELLETVKTYLKDDIVHVEFIILVAIIAISRKAIVWDFKQYTTEQLVGLAIMILALGTTYFLVKKADVTIKLKKGSRQDQQ